MADAQLVDVVDARDELLEIFASQFFLKSLVLDN